MLSVLTTVGLEKVANKCLLCLRLRRNHRLLLINFSSGVLLQNMNLPGNPMTQLIGHLPLNWTTLAQHITDPNVLGQLQNAFNHFVQTGQVWALLIGLCIGYMIRNLTNYG